MTRILGRGYLIRQNIHPIYRILPVLDCLQLSWLPELSQLKFVLHVDDTFLAFFLEISRITVRQTKTAGSGSY